jgi:hypothetical protein
MRTNLHDLSAFPSFYAFCALCFIVSTTVVICSILLIMRFLFGKLVTRTVLTEIFVVSWLLQTNTKIVPYLYQDRFFPNLFHFIILLFDTIYLLKLLFWTLSVVLVIFKLHFSEAGSASSSCVTRGMDCFQVSPLGRASLYYWTTKEIH